MTSRTRSRPTRPGLALAFCDQPGVVQIGGREHALHRPVDAHPADQGPGVDAFQGHDAVAGQVFVQLAFGAEVAHPAARLANDEAGQVRLAAFHVFGVDPVIADLGIGHGDDLAAVARVGEDFLVAGHGGIEADFAVDFADGAEGLSGEDRAVFQGKFRNVAW